MTLDRSGLPSDRMLDGPSAVRAPTDARTPPIGALGGAEHPECAVCGEELSRPESLRARLCLECRWHERDRRLRAADRPRTKGPR